MCDNNLSLASFKLTDADTIDLENNVSTDEEKNNVSQSDNNCKCSDCEEHLHKLNNIHNDLDNTIFKLKSVYNYVTRPWDASDYFRLMLTFGCISNIALYSVYTYKAIKN